MAAPISSIALASEYVLTVGWVGGVRPAVCPLGCGPSMRKFPLELSSFIMTQSPYERLVTRSVSALLTGSSRQRLNGLIADWTGAVLVSVDCSGFHILFTRFAPGPSLLLCAKHLFVAPTAEVQAIVAPAHLEQSEARDLGSWSVVETPISAIVQSNETSRRLKCWEARQRRKSGVPSFPEGRFRPLG